MVGRSSQAGALRRPKDDLTADCLNVANLTVVEELVEVTGGARSDASVRDRPEGGEPSAPSSIAGG